MFVSDLHILCPTEIESSNISEAHGVGIWLPSSGLGVCSWENTGEEGQRWVFCPRSLWCADLAFIRDWDSELKEPLKPQTLLWWHKSPARRTSISVASTCAGDPTLPSQALSAWAIIHLGDRREEHYHHSPLPSVCWWTLGFMFFWFGDRIPWSRALLGI